jgi:hypothetical protein
MYNGLRSTPRPLFSILKGVLEGPPAAETGDIREAERLLGRSRASLGGRDWAYFLPSRFPETHIPRTWL